MRKLQCLLRASAVGLAVALAAPAARAQFPGDLFFTETALLVPEGTTAVLRVEVFAGTAPLGAASFDVHVDPLDAELVDLRLVDAPTPPTGPAAPLELAQRAVSGGVAAAVFSPTSLVGPTGSVALVEVELRPLQPVGEFIQVTVTPRAVLDTDGAPLGDPDGGSAVLLVGEATSSAASIPTLETERHPGPWSPWLDARLGAVPVRPAGAVVEVFERRYGPRGWEVVRRRIATYDPAAPSERTP